jgi:hypothetical protein
MNEIIPETTPVELQVSLFGMLLGRYGSRSCGSFMIGFLVWLGLVSHIGFAIGNEISVSQLNQKKIALFMSVSGDCTPILMIEKETSCKLRGCGLLLELLHGVTSPSKSHAALIALKHGKAP